jgi:hypothetical protein
VHDALGGQLAHPASTAGMPVRPSRQAASGSPSLCQAASGSPSLCQARPGPAVLAGQVRERGGHLVEEVAPGQLSAELLAARPVPRADRRLRTVLRGRARSGLGGQSAVGGALARRERGVLDLFFAHGFYRVGQRGRLISMMRRSRSWAWTPTGFGDGGGVAVVGKPSPGWLRTSQQDRRHGRRRAGGRGGFA